MSGLTTRPRAGNAARACLGAVTALVICAVTGCGSGAAPVSAPARPNPLTGIGTAGRVLAVKIEHVGAAQSQQRGLNGADVVYVEQVEGGLSRYLAVYDSSRPPGQVGPVRSARQTSSPPTPEQYDDTAQAIASATAPSGGGGDVASMTDTVTISLGAMPSGFSLMGNGHFHGSRLGLDYDYAITCKNVAGAVGLCGPTTDQATVDVSWSGNLDTANVDASVTRNGSWSVSGLQSDTATFNGDSSFSLDTTAYPNGNHAVEVRATDSSGNVAILPDVPVVVQN